MHLRAIFSIMLLFAAGEARADDAQTALARLIEEASVTSSQAYFATEKPSDAGAGVGWTLYPPVIYRRDLDVDGCDVTARIVRVHEQNAQDTPLTEITFDLTRTRVLDASAPVGHAFAYEAGHGEGSGGTAAIELQFVPPYAPPLIWSDSAGVVVERPVQFIWFQMEPVADEAQPRRLLALLNRYQDAYCSFQM